MRVTSRSAGARAGALELRLGRLAVREKRCKRDPGHLFFIRNSHEVCAVALVICPEDHEKTIATLHTDTLTDQGHIHVRIDAGTCEYSFPVIR